MAEKNGHRFKKAVLTVGVIILSIFLASAGIVYVYVRQSIYRVSTKQDIEKQDNDPIRTEYYNGYIDIMDEGSEIDKNPEPDTVYEEVQGVSNILLIGADARNLNEKARSDSILIVTVDSNKKKLKLTSILRDSYVDIQKHGKQKINAAFAYGGPELLMDTIERNFKIKMDKYIAINFWGFEKVVDMLGGITIEVKDYEVDEINKYIGEVDESKSPMLAGSGIQHLDGQQTLAYSRIRQVGNGSYERNQRQRNVLSLLAEKLKDTKVIQYGQLLSGILPCVKTNIEPLNLINYAYTVSKFKPMTIEQLQMPMTELCEGRIYNGSWVFLFDKEQNSKVLNDFIYNDRVTKKEELNIRAFKQKINEYLRSKIKDSPAINQNNAIE